MRFEFGGRTNLIANGAFEIVENSNFFPNIADKIVVYFADLEYYYLILNSQLTRQSGVLKLVAR
jgi:hypothetical protein